MKMNIILHLNISMIFLAGSLVFIPNTVSADDTCGGDVYVEGHDELWAYISDINVWDFRDWAAPYFNLQHDDWDGGWGYHGLDDLQPSRIEFPKMMNAGFLLLAGLNDSERFQSAWKLWREYTGVIIKSDIAAVSRNSNHIDAAFISHYDSLWVSQFYKHIDDDDEWFPGEISNNSQAVEIFAEIKGVPVKFNGTPAIVSRSELLLDIFARSHRKLIQVSVNDAASTLTTWDVTSDTVRIPPSNDPYCQYRYCIDSDPVVLSRTPDTLDVFARDDTLDHLIHYYWSETDGWNAEDITEGIAISGISHNGKPAIVLHDDAVTFSVFVRGDYGEVFHYKGSPSTGWTVEDLTVLTRSGAIDFPVASDPVVVWRGSEALHLFARHKDNYSLVHFYRSSVTGWKAEDLTKKLDGEPIDGNPAALSRTGTTLNVFARGFTFGNLVHYYWTAASGWGTEDVTGRVHPTLFPYTLTGNPVVSGSQDRVDVLARRNNGIVHFFWNPSTSWLVENVQDSPNIGSNSLYSNSDPVVVSRRPDVLDMLLPGGDSIVYVTSAGGPNVRQWHTNSEYSSFASGSLNDFKYIPFVKSGNAGADANRGLFSTDQVRMFCGSWDETPATLASYLIHEAAHMVFWDIGGDSHVLSPAGEKCGDDLCWDPWFSHGLGGSEGDLPGYCNPGWGEGCIGPARNHSAYQLEVEYLCDIAEFARPSLPPKTGHQDTRASANGRLLNNITNPPGWSCGVPRPIY